MCHGVFANIAEAFSDQLKHFGRQAITHRQIAIHANRDVNAIQPLDPIGLILQRLHEYRPVQRRSIFKRTGIFS